MKNNQEYDLLHFMPVKNKLFNYYQNNNVDRSSKIMIECTKILEKKNNNFLK
jgi:hypothetical protein